MLGGPDAKPELSQSKINYLTEQLDLRKRLLEDKSLMLSELDNLAGLLTQQAAIALPDGLHLYKEVQFLISKWYTKVKSMQFAAIAIQYAQQAGRSHTKQRNLRRSKQALLFSHMAYELFLHPLQYVKNAEGSSAT